jgi:hypothetical protein
MKNINIVKELEQVLYHPTYMGMSDKVGVNLAVNAIINRIDELGWDITEKPVNEKFTHFGVKTDCAVLSLVLTCGDIIMSDEIRKMFGLDESSWDGSLVELNTIIFNGFGVHEAFEGITDILLK